ncbi:C1 family peptidase [Methanobrevibacter sp.]|uniref:C1 family peptidase n=1 Tax=Methanobrevibacter sp. TaxID=66852 RepID=UPI00386CF45F
MFNKRLLLLFSIALILFIVPSVFGADNGTVCLDSSSDTQILSDDVYFDSNATNDHGEGTADDPYRELRDGRILDNSVIHLKNGEYELSQITSHKNISIIGQDASKTIVNGNGNTLRVDERLFLANVTLCNLNILNQGNLIASDAIFANSTATKSGGFGNSLGGVIYCVNENNNAYLTNCTFINNYAGCGGAIYVKGGILEITDCVFINNTARNYGGAIAAEPNYSKGSSITIKRSKFINDTSLKDAGGAVYIKSGTFAGEDLNVSGCSATFGGAFAILKSYVSLNNLYAIDNSAIYEGGVIYQIYGNLTIKDSQLSKNHARNGGGLFVDDSYLLDVLNVSFINNSAILVGGAFYSLTNNNYDFRNITYINNTAFEFDDLYRQDNMSAIFLSGDYTLYNHIIDDSPLPSYYSSVDEGYVTPAKNQQDGGNCWAFASLATLESAILKASGDELDLSEENMKNLASIYSHYGWSMETNEGGYDNMGFSYLTSWLGPVLDASDEYNGFTVLSPMLDGIMHVQNILFLKRSSYNDNDEIKRAIRDYGGVYTPIYMIAHYDYSANNYVQCYRGNLPCDHAVELVGWDDNFQMSGAPGKGAWIAKNSWGNGWGNTGYFYISYFDNSCLKPGKNDGGYAFIFNDTMKYDKNYQYDIAKTDYFFNTTKTVWYKNIFTATDSEYLAAVSTYFEKYTHWELTVKVNDMLKLIKSGDSHAGYCTLDLGQLIAMNVGDVFEIMFKITVNGDAGVPISEAISLNNRFYHENISYISYDGKTWRDMFNITWEYPEHTYESQVACIKAFTILNPINATVAMTYENKTSDRITIVANVLNQWGYPVKSGNVRFNVGGETYVIAISNGIAKMEIDLESVNVTAEFDQVGYNPAMARAELRNPLLDTTMTLNVTAGHNPINITANLVDEYGNPVKCGNVVFDIAGVKYSVDVVNGIAKIADLIVSPLKFTVDAQYNDLFYYNPSHAIESVELSLINTKISLDITTTEANNPVSIVAHVLDLNDNPVEYGTIAFYMSNELVKLSVVNGTARINHTFRQSGDNVIYVTFYDNAIYNSSVYSETISVSKMKVNLTLDISIVEDNAYLAIGIKDSPRGFVIKLRVNDDNYTYSSTESYVRSELINLKKGSYNYIIELVSSIYESDNLVGTFNIVHQKTQIEVSGTSLYYNGDYSVILKDESGNIVANRDVYLTVDGKTIKKRTDGQGKAVFNLAVPSGSYAIDIDFIGDDEYIKSSKNTYVNIKSTVEFNSNKYVLNAKYSATLRDSKGNPLKNKQIQMIFNGISYKLNSDANGQISLNVNLKPGTYTVKVTNPATGEVMTQKITVVKRITQNKDLKMYYGAGKSYKVKVVDDYGKVAKNLRVTFKISGKKYYAYTDKNGYASLKISKKPGKYVIAAEYKGFKVSNKITVKSTIVTKNIKVKKSKAIQFKAKLLNSKGKVMKNKKITFKFKGKTYKVKTNKKGIAVLKITKKYKKGKYTITSKYGALKIKNSIRIV